MTFWVEHPQGRRENVKLHVLNRSPDPVTEVHVALRVRRGQVDSDGEHQPFGEKEELWELPLANLGPCAATVYSATEMRLEQTPRNYIKSLDDDWPKLSDQYYWVVELMYFVDRSGGGWIRTTEGLDELSSPLDLFKMDNVIWWDDEEVNEAPLCEGESVT